ncbi:MAG: PAS domain-containing protein, partial [Pontibacterium sp.]
SEDEFIVSKSDTSGKITYTNRTLMRITGYSEPEMLGKQHNMLRHPDMPRAVFQLLWDTLSQRQEFFGIVKNMCKDGSHYWVIANITPDFDPDGSLRGYYSVRRKPHPFAVETMDAIYRRMLDIERQHGAKEAMTASRAYLDEQLEKTGKAYTKFVLELNQGVL